MESIRTRELRRARQRAVTTLETLRVPGVHIRMSAEKLLTAIEQTGFARRNEKTADFLNLFADVVGERRAKPSELAAPRKEYAPPRHLRQADIDAQPRQVSMGGIGIGEGVMGQNIKRGR